MVDLVGEPRGEEEVEAAEAESAGSRKWLWIGLGAAAFLAINIGLTFALSHGGGDSGNATESQAVETQSAAPQAASAEPQGNAIFYALDPAFVVNFKDANAIRFLQVKVEVMTHDPSVVDAIKKYSPIIRNNLLMLYSGQSYDTLSTRSGKEKLQKETLSEIRKVLDAKTGRGGINAVYFTSFVMQ